MALTEEQRERFRVYEPNIAAYARYRHEIEINEQAFAPAPVWVRLGAVLGTAAMMAGVAGPWLTIQLPDDRLRYIRGIQTDGFFVGLFGGIAFILLVVALCQPDTEVPAAIALGANILCTFIAIISVLFLQGYRPGIIGVAPTSIMLGWGVYFAAAASLIATAFTVLVVRRSATF